MCCFWPVASRRHLPFRHRSIPSKTIKIIVPNPPGGSGDISARFVAQKLSESLHQSVVVENQAGASGTLGMNMVKRAPPDGYTIGVVISLAQVVDRIQNKTSSFDLTTDFTPLTAIANNPVILLAHPKVPATTLKDFIAYVRERPGEISYSSPGIGTAHHLYGEVLNRTAGIKMVNVPYKGVAPAMNDLLGGHVQAGDHQPVGGAAAHRQRQGECAGDVRHQAQRQAAGGADRHRGGAKL